MKNDFYDAEQDRLDALHEAACQSLREQAHEVLDDPRAIDDLFSSGNLHGEHFMDLICTSSLPESRRKSLVMIAHAVLMSCEPDDCIDDSTIDSMASVLADKISERMGWAL